KPSFGMKAESSRNGTRSIWMRRLHDMWREVANDYKDKMMSTLDVVKTMADEFGGEGTWDMLLPLFWDAPEKLTEPYKTEIKAMADLTGIPVEQLTLLNLFYEVDKACTSLIAIDHNGKTYHGRNLDFGTFFLWDTEKHTWGLTSGLIDLVVQLEFQKGGKQLFKAVTFAGHLGVFTGSRPTGAYSISTNTRFGRATDVITNFFMNGLIGDQQFVMYAYRICSRSMPRSKRRETTSRTFTYWFRSTLRWDRWMEESSLPDRPIKRTILR
ncbi:hypothetical protein PENTCL1PPCAC_30735, partial [Pristionchus entomophagus]